MSAVKKFLLARHLLMSNTATTCVQMGVADGLQQIINGDIGKNGWDWKRTVRMAGVGLVLGPMLHGFYRVLDSRKFTGSKKVVVFKKCFWDAAFMPMFSCSVITVGSMFEGNSLKQGLREYQDKMWHIMQVDFSIWPPAQLISFYYLSNAYRVVYINLVALVYNCIMSYIKNNDINVIKKAFSIAAIKKKILE